MDNRQEIEQAMGPRVSIFKYFDSHGPEMCPKLFDLVKASVSGRGNIADFSRINAKLREIADEELIDDPDYNTSLSVMTFLSQTSFFSNRAVPTPILSRLLSDGKVQAYLSSDKFCAPSEDVHLHFKIVNGFVEKAVTGRWPAFLCEM
jgi:hypothetical protein